MGISKIEVITSQNKLSALKKTLAGMGVSGITAIQALGCGVQHGTQAYEVEVHEQMELLPKQYIMILVEDEKVEKVERPPHSPVASSSRSFVGMGLVRS